tara:strand:+ start:43 stop:828 length:786 start_codon:yes stop_codon:yes gene_type:complete
MAYIGDGPKPELEVGDISTKDVTATGDLTVDTNTLFVDASENKVGIGMTSSLEKFTVANTSSGIVSRFTNNTNQTLDLGITSGSGSAGGAYLNNANSGYIAFQSGTSERLRMLAGGGLTFNGDTAAANALDDYEEGTWTPVVAAGWSSPSYAYQNGNYQKVGNLVEAFFFIQFSSSSSTGAHVQITGLPFTSVNETGGALRGGALTYFTTPVDAPGMVLAYVFQNATEFRLYHGNDGGASTLSNGAASLSFLIGSVVYRVS